MTGLSDGGGGGPSAVLSQALRGQRKEVLLRGRLPHQVSVLVPCIHAGVFQLQVQLQDVHLHVFI